MSFFRDEPIVGSFLCGFSFIILGYIFNFLKSRKTLKISGLLIILSILIGVMLTGERSNSLKALIGFYFYFFN